MMFTCPFLVLFILSSVCLWGADGIEAKLLEEGRTREEKIKPLAQALNQGDKLAAQGELLRACEEVGSRKIGREDRMRKEREAGECRCRGWPRR